MTSEASEQPTRNWLDLPSDITLNILQRVGAFDILENAQKVCTAWREICKDPAMWRVVCLDNFLQRYACQKMCKLAVDRSQGQLVDLTIGYCDQELLKYVANRSSKLRRLEMRHFMGDTNEAFKNLSLLEELSFRLITEEVIVAAGHYCPLLRSLIVKTDIIGNTTGNAGLQAILDGCCHLESLDLSGCYTLNLNEDLKKRCSQQIKYLKLPINLKSQMRR